MLKIICMQMVESFDLHYDRYSAKLHCKRIHASTVTVTVALKWWQHWYKVSFKSNWIWLFELCVRKKNTGSRFVILERISIVEYICDVISALVHHRENIAILSSVILSYFLCPNFTNWKVGSLSFRFFVIFKGLQNDTFVIFAQGVVRFETKIFTRLIELVGNLFGPILCDNLIIDLKKRHLKLFYNFCLAFDCLLLSILRKIHFRS